MDSELGDTGPDLGCVVELPSLVSSVYNEVGTVTYFLVGVTIERLQELLIVSLGFVIGNTFTAEQFNPELFLRSTSFRFGKSSILGQIILFPLRLAMAIFPYIL